MKKILTLVSLWTLLYHTQLQTQRRSKQEETKFLVTSPLKMDTTLTNEYVPDPFYPQY